MINNKRSRIRVVYIFDPKRATGCDGGRSMDCARISQRLSRKPPLRDVAYSHIKSSILSGQLQPGEAILENDIWGVRTFFWT